MSAVYDQHGQRVSKAEVTRWIRRVREGLRDIESAMRAGDWQAAALAAEDVDPAGGEIRSMIELLAAAAAEPAACQCPPFKPGAVSFGCRCDATPAQVAEFEAEWSRWVD